MLDFKNLSRPTPPRLNFRGWADKKFKKFNKFNEFIFQNKCFISFLFFSVYFSFFFFFFQTKGEKKKKKQNKKKNRVIIKRSQILRAFNEREPKRTMARARARTRTLTHARARATPVGQESNVGTS